MRVQMLMLASLLAFGGCTTKPQDGEPGPTGPAGPTGPTGATGPAGTTAGGAGTGGTGKAYLGDLDITDEVIAAEFCANYDRVYGDLWVGDYEGDDLNALACLVEVRGDLHLHSSAQLLRAELPSLVLVTGRVDATGSELSVIDFPELAEVGSGLHINVGHDSNTGSVSMPNLQSVGQDLDIESHAEATGLTFSSLTDVGAILSLHDMPLLENLDGFPALDVIGDHLHIRRNDRLTDIGALSTLTYVGGVIDITENGMLSTGHANSVVGEIDYIGGQVSVDNNAP